MSEYEEIPSDIDFLPIPQLTAEEFQKLMDRRDIPQEWYEEEEDSPFWRNSETIEPKGKS